MRLSRLARHAGTFGPILTVVGVAIVVRALSWLNNDSSDLITFAEDFIDGARPYVDFREVNPPASLLIYMPAALLGRWFALPPEAVLTIGIFAATLMSLWLLARILRDAELLARWEALALAPAALAILLILPEHVFGQREHMALIAMLPMLSCYAARASGQPISHSSAIVVGIGGGLATCIKPHFALALLLPLIYAAWSVRRDAAAVWRTVLSPENISAALLLAAYGAVIVLAFPEYLTLMLPILSAVYIPARLPWSILLRTRSIVIVLQAAVAITIIAPRKFLQPLPLVFGLAAMGFLLGILIQGKGWPYHGYPAIALMLLILCTIAIERWPEFRATSRRVPWALAVVFLIGGLYAISSVWFWPFTWYSQLVSGAARLAPPNPKIAALCGGTQYLFPLVRIVHGTAVDDVLWVNDAVIAQRRYNDVSGAGLKIVERYADDESRGFILAIEKQKPDVLVVCDGWKEWALAQPNYASMLSKYRSAAVLENSEIWLPK